MGSGAGTAKSPASTLKTFAWAGLRFTYPASWYAGGEENANGAINRSAGIDAPLTFLSDQPFEPMCTTVRSTDGSSTTCGPPPSNDVWVNWHEPIRDWDLTRERRYSRPFMVDGVAAWIYRGKPVRACPADSRLELVVEIPADATLPGGQGLQMDACFHGNDLATHVREVEAMLGSATVPRPTVSRPLTAKELCDRSFEPNARSSGMVDVAWVRARVPVGREGPAKDAFASAPDSDPAAWCWIGKHRYRWELRTVDVYDPNGPMLATSDADVPPALPTVK